MNVEGFTVDQMKEMQRQLQEKYKDKWEGVAPEIGQNKLLWMIGEIGEVIDVIKQNGSSSIMADPAIRTHFVEEMADVLMYYNDILLCFDISQEELKQAYTEKFQRNMTRWQEEVNMNDRDTSIQTIRDTVLSFQNARGWTVWQNARNVAISICLEASELLEIFQWCDNAEADRKARETDREHFREELADVLIYCISMANAYDVDIATAISEKLEKNAKKYPIE